MAGQDLGGRDFLAAFGASRAATTPFAFSEVAAVTGAGFVSGSFAFSPKMLVSRMQDHIIETSDGALHMLINMGPGQGLTLFTSTDDGDSWQVSDTIPDSGFSSTADIRLVPGSDIAAVVYTSDSGEVVFARMDYNDATGSWSTPVETVIATGVTGAASAHPTVVVADSGRIFVAWIEEERSGISVQIAWSDDGGRDWTTSGLILLDAEAGAARAIATESGLGVIYSTADEMIWASYDPGLGAWTHEVVHDAGAIGKFSSHFSTAEYGDTVYLVSVDVDQNLVYLEYDAPADSWSQAEILPVTVDSVSSVQISVDADGAIFVTYDDAETGDLVVIESGDGGASWSVAATLDTPDFLQASPIRFEAPENFDGELVIVQQVAFPFFEMGTLLYSWVIDTDAPASGTQAVTVDWDYIV